MQHGSCLEAEQNKQIFKDILSYLEDLFFDPDNNNNQLNSSQYLGLPEYLEKKILIIHNKLIEFLINEDQENENALYLILEDLNKTIKEIEEEWGCYEAEMADDDNEDLSITPLELEFEKMSIEQNIICPASNSSDSIESDYQNPCKLLAEEDPLEGNIVV